MWANWRHNPYYLGNPPFKGVEIKVGAQPLPSSGPECGQTGSITPSSSGKAKQEGGKESGYHWGGADSSVLDANYPPY